MFGGCAWLSGLASWFAWWVSCFDLGLCLRWCLVIARVGFRVYLLVVPWIDSWVELVVVSWVGWRLRLRVLCLVGVM